MTIKITVNGKTVTIDGGNICINNNTIFCNNKIVMDDIFGSDVIIEGNCDGIDCGGSVTISGNVNGNIDCGG